MCGFIGIGLLTFADLGNRWWLPTTGLIRAYDNFNLHVTYAFYRLDRSSLLLTGLYSDMKRGWAVLTADYSAQRDIQLQRRRCQDSMLAPGSFVGDG
jgi:hypothetical protein